MANLCPNQTARNVYSTAPDVKRWERMSLTANTRVLSELLITKDLSLQLTRGSKLPRSVVDDPKKSLWHFVTLGRHQNSQVGRQDLGSTCFVVALSELRASMRSIWPP